MMSTLNDGEQKEDRTENENENEKEEEKGDIWRQFCCRSEIVEIMKSAKCDGKIGRRRAMRIVSKFKNVEEDGIEIEDESVEFIANQTMRHFRGFISNPTILQQRNVVQQLSTVPVRPTVLWSRPKIPSSKPIEERGSKMSC